MSGVKSKQVPFEEQEETLSTSFKMTKEPLSRAERITVATHTRDPGDILSMNVAAVDFGTTSCTLAYKIRGSERIDCYKFGRYHERVPNAVMIKKDGNRVTVKYFGLDAQDKYHKIGARGCIYFERIKMLLERDETIDRNTKVVAATGQTCYLVEVIALTLKYLKEKLFEHLHTGGVLPKPEQFTWVITVPAIWKAKGKRMMREAAYMARLLDSSEGITKLTEPPNSVPRPPEDSSDRLYLALEPEAAALHARKYTKQILEALSKDCPDTYLVIDAGGGTVDVTVHNEKAGKIVVVQTPSGKGCAGTKVNEAFSEMMQTIVGDKPNFKTFRKANDKSDKTINCLVYEEFEKGKVKFGTDPSKEECEIYLPSEFMQHYCGKINIQAITGVDLEEDVLIIERSRMEILFDAPVKAVVECALNALVTHNDVSEIFVVGGFGACQYVRTKLETALAKDRIFHGANLKVSVPETPILAVAKGAVAWGVDLYAFRPCRAGATYGIAIAPLFDDTKHDTGHKYYDKELGGFRCSDVFCVFLQKGDLVPPNKVYRKSVMPDSKRKMSISIYCTKEVGVQYTKDRNDHSTVQEIGNIKLDIPNPYNLSLAERMVDVSMEFYGLAVKATARYPVTGEKVETVCKFLRINED